jgi:hypothetical protein
MTQPGLFDDLHADDDQNDEPTPLLRWPDEARRIAMRHARRDNWLGRRWHCRCGACSRARSDGLHTARGPPMIETFTTRWHESTNVLFHTCIDSDLGVRVRCEQELDEADPGPVVTVGRGLKGWEVSIRLHSGERVKLTVDETPLLTISGNVPTFGELFDDEADPWDEDADS